MCKFTYGFSKGIPLSILIILSKDPNVNEQTTVSSLHPHQAKVYHLCVVCLIDRLLN